MCLYFKMSGNKNLRYYYFNRTDLTCYHVEAAKYQRRDKEIGSALEKNFPVPIR